MRTMPDLLSCRAMIVFGCGSAPLRCWLDYLAVVYCESYLVDLL